MTLPGVIKQTHPGGNSTYISTIEVIFVMMRHLSCCDRLTLRG